MTSIPAWTRVTAENSTEKIHFAVCLDGIVQQVMNIAPAQAGLWIENPTVVLCNPDAQPGDTIEIATAGL